MKRSAKEDLQFSQDPPVSNADVFCNKSLPHAHDESSSLWIGRLRESHWQHPKRASRITEGLKDIKKSMETEVSRMEAAGKALGKIHACTALSDTRCMHEVWLCCDLFYYLGFILVIH